MAVWSNSGTAVQLRAVSQSINNQGTDVQLNSIRSGQGKYWNGKYNGETTGQAIAMSRFYSTSYYYLKDTFSFNTYNVQVYGQGSAWLDGTNKYFGSKNAGAGLFLSNSNGGSTYYLRISDQTEMSGGGGRGGGTETGGPGQSAGPAISGTNISTLVLYGTGSISQAYGGGGAGTWAGSYSGGSIGNVPVYAFLNGGGGGCAKITGGFSTAAGNADGGSPGAFGGYYYNPELQGGGSGQGAGVNGPFVGGYGGNAPASVLYGGGSYYGPINTGTLYVNGGNGGSTYTDRFGQAGQYAGQNFGGNGGGGGGSISNINTQIR